MNRSENNLKKTCLRIDEETWKKFKIECINKGISANEQITRLISDFMNSAGVHNR